MRRPRRAAALAVAVGLALAACGDDADTAGNDAGGGGSARGDEGTVDRDARIVYASCCGFTSADPHNQAEGGIVGWFPLFDRLTMVGTPEDPKAEVISPMLAASWEYSDDGRQLTFELREDVTFHDGSAVDAEAVQASIERARTSAFGAAKALESVASVEVVDELTVRLVLNEADSTLPAVMATHAGAVINPTVLDDPNVDLDLAPPPEAGSGPYVLSTFEPGNRAVYERASGEYWDPEAAHAAEIELTVVPDPTTRLNGLRAGDYDVIQLTSLSTLEGDRLAESDANFSNYRTDGRTVSVLWLRDTSPELSDVRVRQAIAMAVDREGIAEGALNGTCSPTEQFVAPGLVGYDSDFQTDYSYDLDRARSLLEDAGVSSLDIDIVVPAGATQETIGTALQASLQEIGIDANVQAIPPTDTVTEFINGGYEGSVNAIVGQADSGQVAPTELYTRTALGTDDSTVADLIARGRSELDPAARGGIYQQLNEYVVNEQVWAVPICLAQFSWAAQSKVINVDRMPWQWSALPDVRYLGIVE